jgi:uncharacterized phage-associated protein/DNA-binding transcriptional regulator YiaG
MSSIVKDYTQIFTIRGEEFEVTAPALFDAETDELLYDEKLDDDAIELANDQYRKAHDFFHPEDLKIFRSKLNISGREFALLFGFSPTTIVLYENGALPTESNNRQLKAMIENEESFKRFYLANKSILSKKAQLKVENYLNEECGKFEAVPVIDLVNWFRVKNIALQKSDEYVEDLTQMKVMKLVYYVQGVSLHWFEKPAFSNEILAWEHGPVVKEIYDEYRGKRSIVESIKSVIPDELMQNYEKLSHDKKLSRVLTFVQEQLGDYSAGMLRNKTHNEGPWIKTCQNEVIKNELIKKYFDKNFESIFD